METTRNSIKQKLTEIIKSYLPEDVKGISVKEEMHLIDDLKINSAYLVDIVLDIEDSYDIMLEDEVIGNMNTLKDSIELVYQKVSLSAFAHT